MAVTLTVTDNADNTGGVATIAGAGASDITSFRYARFTGLLETQTFATAAASLTGNGSRSIVLDKGFYLIQAITVTSGSLIVAVTQAYIRFTDGNDTVHLRILDAVVERINTAGFSFLGSAKVLRRWVPAFAEHKEAAPVMFVCPLTTEQYADTIITKDDPGFPVACILADKLNGNGTMNLNQDLDWRIRVSRLFRNQHLPGVPEVNYCKVIPDQIVDLQAFSKNILASTLLFRFYTREERGLY